MLYFNAPSEITQGNIRPVSYQYFFENSTFYLLEISNNRYEVSNHIHQWFMVKKSNLAVISLNLRFVDSSTLVEERFFEEGYLKFNGIEGTFIEKFNSAQHGLTQTNTLAIPTAVHQAVANFMA